MNDLCLLGTGIERIVEAGVAERGQIGERQELAFVDGLVAVGEHERRRDVVDGDFERLHVARRRRRRGS